jgi:hypothetical protein
MTKEKALSAIKKETESMSDKEKERFYAFLIKEIRRALL